MTRSLTLSKAAKTSAVLMLLMLITAACGPASPEADGVTPSATPTPVREDEAEGDPNAQLYRMYIDSADGELELREFVGNIQIADLEAIFGDLDGLPEDENGNTNAETWTDQGAYFVNITPDEAGVNLVARMNDGTLSSIIDLNGDNAADIVDFQLADNRRITIVTELAGLEAFEHWLNGRNPLCQTELAQQLGLPDFGCDDPAEGGGGGGGGAGYGGGIVDPFDIICAGYPTGNQAGIMNAVRPQADMTQAYSYRTYYQSGAERYQLTNTWEYRGELTTRNIIYDYGEDGLLTQVTWEYMHSNGEGSREIQTVDREGNVTSINRTEITGEMDENGMYDRSSTSPPAPPPPHDSDAERSEYEEYMNDGEVVPAIENTGATQGDPGPDGENPNVASFCANRGEHSSGAEQAAGTNPAAFGVSCNDLVGAPSSGDCTIIEWAGGNDFSSILDVPSADDGCGEFQTASESGDCEPTNAIERLRGKVGEIWSLNLPTVVLCPPILCNPAFAQGAQIEEISESGVEEPQLATETPAASGEDTDSATDTPSALSELVVILTSNARCRKGPETAYADHDFFSEGDESIVTGRNADASWLYIAALKNLGSCWIGRGVLDFEANDALLMTLPEIQPPPLPTETPPPSNNNGGGGGNSNSGGQAPAAPGSASWDGQVCTGSNYAVSMSWKDLADNENGYRILRNGAQITLLPANSTSYTDHPPYGGPYTYKIEAYNGAGSNSASVQDPGCIP